MEAARLVSPLNGSKHKVSIVVPFFARLQRLTNHPRSCDRLMPKAQGGSGVRRFGVKETQPICLKGEAKLLAAAISNRSLCADQQRDPAI